METPPSYIFTTIEEAKSQIENINREIFRLRKYKLEIRKAIKGNRKEKVRSQKKRRDRPVRSEIKLIKNRLIGSLRQELFALNQTILDPSIEAYCPDREPRKDFNSKDITQTEYQKRWKQHRNDVANYLRSEIDRIKEANILHKIIWSLN